MLRPIIFMCSLALAGQALAGEAGKVIFVAGAAQVAERSVAEGASVQEGELLSTGADGFLYVKTLDNGLFILRPNTRARIVTYQVDTRNPANTRVKLELLSGVARSKSGDAVKAARQNFRFNTPVAAIGVRGTDFTVYTDQDSSRVAVLSGRVVVSGFTGACSPEGVGPCEGAASRELSASQRGQLLQVQRGQAAPQVLQGGTTPDQIAPPRPDEVTAKAPDPNLDARKGSSLEKIVAAPPPPPPPPGDTSSPPPVLVNQPELPAEPPREILWGRWATVAGKEPTIAFTGPAGSERTIGGPFLLFRTAGQYTAPERGEVSFNLKNSEAYIFHDDPARAALPAEVKNGILNFNFDKSLFTTSFDLVGGNETFQMTSTGSVGSDGRFTTSNESLTTLKSNTEVQGVLSNQNGGTAGYLFHRRLDAGRYTDGVTLWGR